MLGTRISQLRNQRGWTQAQLAKKLEVSCKTIKNWETSISDPSAMHVIALARLFAISSDFLLGIGSNSFINLDLLSPADQKRLRAICQAYIQVAYDDSLDK